MGKLERLRRPHDHRKIALDLKRRLRYKPPDEPEGGEFPPAMINVSHPRTGFGRRTLPPAAVPIRELSNRLVAAQRPIRILDAVKWDEGIERAFFARGGKELPAVTTEYYQSRRLPFDPAAKLEELQAIQRDVERDLGQSAAGRILARMCREYQDVVRMVERRGTPEFAVISRKLYGGAVGCPGPEAFTHLPGDPLPAEEPRPFDATAAVGILAAALRDYFQDPALVRVKLSDGIVADAAAGCEYIKLRADAMFRQRDLRGLEVHEGWVHLGTTLNGQSQDVCTFLSKGPPSSTLTQEGLAVLTEILAGAMHPCRVRRLRCRMHGISLAERGGDFLDVYRHYLSQGCVPAESYQQTMRIFRGSLPANGGPFTKDICYGRGLALVREYIAQAKRQGDQRRIALLFCGKTSAADGDALEELDDLGLLRPARFIPPPFRAVQPAARG